LLAGVRQDTVSFEYGTTPVQARSLRYDDNIIVAYIPTAELDSFRITPILTVGIIGGFGVILLVFLIFFIMNRVVLKPLDKITAQVEDLRGGQRINTEDLKGDAEFVFIGQAVNDLLNRAETEILEYNSLEAEPAATAVPETGAGEAVYPSAALDAVQMMPVAAGGEIAGQAAEDAAVIGVQDVAGDTAGFGTQAAAVTAGASQTASAGQAGLRTAGDFQLDQIFHMVVPLIGEQLQQKSLGFSVLLDKAVPRQLFGDYLQISEALTDLLVGCVAAIPKCGRIKCVSKLLEVKEGIYNVRVSAHCSSALAGETTVSFTFLARESDPDDILQDL
jgi:hypothetical protein